jgi:hypothetical protein
MVQAHRDVMGRINGSVRPVFIDTPANFEPNVDSIARRAVEYFQTHFGLSLDTISFPTAQYPTPVALEEVLRQLRRANYLFSGPGSPTYAVRAWRNTAVFETMAGKLASGSHVVLASAAVTSMGRYTLPVYEIYKVGLDLHWTDGLDLLGRYGLNLACIPHWNNASGETHDTSRCFMGEARLRRLEQMLPPDVVILGIDEFTACIVDLNAHRCHVLGQGGVTIRTLDGEADRFFASGESFEFTALRYGNQGRVPTAATLPADDAAVTLYNQAVEVSHAFQTALHDKRDPAHAVGFLHGLMEALKQGKSAGLDDAVCTEVELMVREMLALLAVWLEDVGTRSATAGLIDRIVDLRQAMRTAKQWEMTDQLRNLLSAEGIVVEDGRNGSSWRWAN